MRDAGRALAAVRETRPDFVFALYSGQSAVDFVEAYAGSGLARRIPLAGSSFLADETLLPAMGPAALGVRSCLSWAPELPSAANRAFTAAYRRATGERPDAFAVLGYEAARLIGAAMAGAAGGGDRLRGLCDALKATALEGPRGRVTMDAATQVTRAPLYLREVRSRNGAVGNEVVAELPPLSDPARSMAALRSGPKSGWLNEYPSA
jgi:branched-chain amino acid transport system substrate-binding protein